MAQQDFDETLKNIAKSLYLRTDIDNVGKALKFSPAEIGRYCEENSRQSGSYMGTLDMLRTWRNRQTPATAPNILREALQEASLHHLAHEYLSSCKSSDNNQEQMPSVNVHAGACITEPDRIATTAELNKLASLLHGDFYTDLAVHLGLEPAEFDNVRRENPTLKDANFRMLLKWKAKESGGLVVELDKALNESGCGALSKQYKEN